MAGPKFLSQFTTRTSVRWARVDSAIFWKGSRLVDRCCFSCMERRTVHWNASSRLWKLSGISQCLGSHVDSTCSLGLKASSVSSG